MDLITHIPGVGPTAAFNPGVNTPAPYNVPQTGATDGTGPANATKNMAEIYNRDLLWRRALIANAGLVFDPLNWVQEVAAIEAMIAAKSILYCTAAGTADALTGNFTPDVLVLGGPFTVYVRAAAANATTTPTFKADATVAKTIVKGNNLPLAAGDIAGAGHWLQLQFDLTLDKWVLLNPAVPFGGFGKVLASSGYQRLPGGLIFQWGNMGAGVVQVFFPVAFNTVYQTFMTPDQNTAGSIIGYDLRDDQSGWPTSILRPGTSINCRWFAVGI